MAAGPGCKASRSRVAYASSMRSRTSLGVSQASSCASVVAPGFPPNDAAAEHQGDDPAAHVLVDAAQGLGFDLQAGLLADFPLQAGADGLVQFQHAAGCSQWPLSRRRTASETSFFRGNVWRAQAEHLADSWPRGTRVIVTRRLRQRSWETAEGEKRSVTELEADEVGASLKWATAKIERSGQRGNGDRTQGRERQVERGGDFNDAPPF
jgi:hypothetical protein